MRRLLPTLVLLAACTSTAPQPGAPLLPQWDAIPAGIPAALCERLQMDGIGTLGAEVAIVAVTQPVATPQSLAQLGKPKRPVAVVNRALPVMTASSGSGTCVWKSIDALDPARQFDSMVVELSSPVPNPASRHAAGIVARVTLGGAHPSIYWIELIPHSGGWSVGRIFPLAM